MILHMRNLEFNSGLPLDDLRKKESRETKTKKWEKFGYQLKTIILNNIRFIREKNVSSEACLATTICSYRHFRTLRFLFSGRQISGKELLENFDIGGSKEFEEFVLKFFPEQAGTIFLVRKTHECHCYSYFVLFQQAAEGIIRTYDNRSQGGFIYNDTGDNGATNTWQGCERAILAKEILVFLKSMRGSEREIKWDRNVEIFLDYFLHDLSLGDLSEKYKISKMAVDFTLKKIIKKIRDKMNKIDKYRRPV